MIEARELLESEELNEIVLALESFLATRNLPRKNPDQKSFKYLALGKRFRAREVIEILIDEAPAYPGFKEVLAAGFASWVLFPDEKAVLNFQMTQEALWHLDGAERRAGLVKETMDVKRDLIARYVFTGVDFLSDIYDELGGYEAFTRINDVETMRNDLEPARKSIDTAVKAMTFLHHGSDSYIDPEHDFPPSLNRAVVILKELKGYDGRAFKEKFVSRSRLHEYWSATKDTLALLYAASTIKVGRKTLLDLVWSLNISHDEISKHLHLWLGRARYVSAHILAKMPDTELYDETERLLPDISPVPFAAPDISSKELTVLRSQFKRSQKARDRPLPN